MSRTRSKCTKDKRCPYGYHLKGTKTPNKDSNEPQSENNKNYKRKSEEKKDEKSGLVKKDDVKTFFLTMMRFLAKDPPQKKREEEKDVSQENLMNLFSKLMF